MKAVGRVAGVWLAAALGMLATHGFAAQSVTGPGPDDFNTSTLTQDPAILVGFGNNVAQCPWINTAMNAFDAANPGWTYSWSTVSFQNRLNLNQYYPWVVTDPKVYAPAPDSTVFIGGQYTNLDSGGAAFSLQYAPRAGDPTNVSFVQAFQEILYYPTGTVTNVRLDNGTNGMPYYGGALGINRGTNNISWLLDSPFDSEPGNPTNQVSELEGYHTDVEFQTVVAVDTGAGGGFTHNVVLYNGYWWGYQYTNIEVPEPAAAGLLCIGTAVWLASRRRRK